MITIITGTPGSGKTALCVDLIIREYKDRLIYNDGLEGLQIDHQTIDAMEWHETAPDGALIIVDEVQRKWRPRGPSAKVPDSVAALETHRHRGIDFIVITQNLKLVDHNVRALSGRHLHIRDTGFLGRWLYEWPEADLNNNWKRCENKRRYKLPKHVFKLYKSASLHTKPVRNTPTMLYIVGVLLVAFLALAVFIYGRFNNDPAPDISSTIASPGPSSAAVLSGGASPSSNSSPSVSEDLLLIDDRIDWIPRVSTYPESAPAYDQVRRVVTFPQVIGGMCTDKRCICITQQGTNAGLSDDECRAEIDRPRFNPYQQQTPAGQPQAQHSPSSSPPTSPPPIA